MHLRFLASTLARGGAETMAAELSRGLMRRGHEVEWILLREPGVVGESLKQELSVHAEVAPGKADWLDLREAVQRLRGAHGLYVLDHDNAALVASVAARLAGVGKRFLAVHTTGRWGGGRSLGRVMRLTLPAYTSVLALSPAHKTYLVEHEGLKADSIRIVPNGLDLSRFDDLPEAETVRRELGLKPHAEVLGSVAMLRPEKNHALLLAVARDLLPGHPELQVVLVGSGPEREGLERLAQELNLRGKVHFLGRRDDVPRVLRACDVLVLTSHPLVETQPLAVLEALAAGIPVVASRVGDLGTMLRDEVGLLVEPGSRAGFVAAVDRVLRQKAETETMRERGRRRVQEYSLDASLDILERLLLEAL